MKIFKLNDCEWWMAETMDDAVADYLKTYGLTIHDTADVIDDPAELSTEEMDRLVFSEEDGAKCSFRQRIEKLQAEGMAVVGCFASTKS